MASINDSLATYGIVTFNPDRTATEAMVALLAANGGQSGINALGPTVGFNRELQILAGG